jgi:hypothetical protein
MAGVPYQKRPGWAKAGARVSLATSQSAVCLVKFYGLILILSH